MLHYHHWVLGSVVAVAVGWGVLLPIPEIDVTLELPWLARSVREVWLTGGSMLQWFFNMRICLRSSCFWHWLQRHWKVFLLDSLIGISLLGEWCLHSVQHCLIIIGPIGLFPTSYSVYLVSSAIELGFVADCTTFSRFIGWFVCVGIWSDAWAPLRSARLVDGFVGEVPIALPLILRAIWFGSIFGMRSVLRACLPASRFVSVLRIELLWILLLLCQNLISHFIAHLLAIHCILAALYVTIVILLAWVRVQYLLVFARCLYHFRFHSSFHLMVILASVLKWRLVVQKIIVIEFHFFVELGVELGQEPVVCWRAHRWYSDNLIFTVGIFCFINPDINLIGLHEVLLAVVVI